MCATLIDFVQLVLLAANKLLVTDWNGVRCIKASKWRHWCWKEFVDTHRPLRYIERYFNVISDPEPQLGFFAPDLVNVCRWLRLVLGRKLGLASVFRGCFCAGRSRQAVRLAQYDRSIV